MYHADIIHLMQLQCLECPLWIQSPSLNVPDTHACKKSSSTANYGHPLSHQWDWKCETGGNKNVWRQKAWMTKGKMTQGMAMG